MNAKSAARNTLAQEFATGARLIEQLFPYQEEGAAWLVSKRHALLADEQGLGKSAQSIEATNQLATMKVLVLCPAIARINWTREFAKFSKRAQRWKLLASSADLHEPPLMIPAADTSMPGIDGVVCSYDLLLTKTVSTSLLATRWDVLILDEAHFLKATDAQRAKIVMGKGGLVHKAARTWMLTGTPAPNDYSELWIPCYVFGRTKLGYEAFRAHFCELKSVCFRTPKGGAVWRDVVVGSQNVDELREIIKPFTLRRLKKDVLKDLPPILYSDVVVEPSEVDIERWYPEVMCRLKTEATLMEEIAQEQAAIDAVVNLTGLGKDGLTALAGLNTKTSQTRRFVGLQKTPAIAKIVAEELKAKAYDKIVLFAWHRDVIVDLQERLKDFHPLTLFGGTPPEKRDTHIKKFQSVPKYKVMICNIKAAGTAITLTAAHQVGMVECSYVPGDNAQAIMRVHRIGQTKPVTARFFGLADSTDEKVQQVLKRKTRDITQLFDSVDSSPQVVNPFED